MCIQPTILDYVVAKLCLEERLNKKLCPRAARARDAVSPLKVRFLRYEVLRRFVGPADGGVHPVQSGLRHVSAPGGSQKPGDASDV
jgi:hypothetical protein